MSRPRFLLDGMLGKLARWLRLFGFDSKYRRALSDEDLIDLVLVEGRVLLTRDFDLYRRAKRRDIETLLIEGRSEAEKLAEVAMHFGVELEVDPGESRCPRCNALLRRVEKEAVRGKVPLRTYEVYEEFWVCEGCGQVYWRGTHWRNINRVMEEAKSILRKRESRHRGGE